MVKYPVRQARPTLKRVKKCKMDCAIGPCSVALLLVLVQFSYGNVSGEHLCGDVFAWDKARLPQTILPLHYDLVLRPNLTEFVFTGNVTVIINVTKDTDVILLNSANLNINNVQLRWRNTENTNIPVSVQFCPQREQMAIKISMTLRTGQIYNLSMIFDGNLTDTLRGLYRSSYWTKDGKQKYMAVTQFSPTDARRMLPCWDEPLFKATFQISIIRDPQYISLSNTPMFSKVNLSDGLVMDQFGTTLKMSTYLVAVVVFDFPKRTARTKRGVEVSLYAPEIQINQTSYALQVAVDSLEFHEQFLKIAYALNKMDIVAVGDFAFGAMENWGLMTFRDTTILFDPERSSTSDADQLTTVVSHEIGHQWFGNLVSMKWWADLWLKEGFARFLETFAASKIRPDWGLMDLFGVNVISLAFNLDGMIHTHPVYVPVEESSDIRGIFDVISYNKGASIIYMLLNILGEDNLAAGLHDYLSTYQYSSVNGADFWRILAQHAQHLEGQQLDEIANSWTLQAGYPYVIVQGNGSTLSLHQKRFYYLKKYSKADETHSTWSIPFTYTTDQGENRLVWFNNSSITVELGKPFDRWVKANINGTGFYRVLYPHEIWHELGRILLWKPQTFSLLDRSNLVIDAFGFLQATLLNVTFALDLAKYLRLEFEYGPWKAALDNLYTIEAIHIGTDLREPFRDYVRSLLEPVFDQLNWTVPSGHKERRFHALIMDASCHFNVSDSKHRAVKMFENWTNNGIKIPPVLLNTVATEAILANDDHWDIVWNAYNRSNTPSEKIVLLHALCASPSKEKLEGLLNASLDSTKIRANLLPTIAAEVAANPNDGMRVMWQFTKDNWATIYKVAGGTAVLGNYLSSALRYFSEIEDIVEIRVFFFNRDINGAKRHLDEALERIQINIQWRIKNDEELEKYLHSGAAYVVGVREVPYYSKWKATR